MAADRRACASSSMPPTPPIDPARDARDLLDLAAWYRSWAELTDSDKQKALRLEFANGIEKRAHELLKPD
jgi:hypothetical protein